LELDAHIVWIWIVPRMEVREILELGLELEVSKMKWEVTLW